MLSRKQKGSYTIEGALSLAAFLTLTIIMLSFIAVIRCENIVQNALCRTADEISGLCYIVDRTVGIDGEKQGISDSIIKIWGKLGDSADLINSGTDATLSKDTIAELCQNVGDGYAEIKSVSDRIKGIYLESDGSVDNTLTTLSGILGAELSGKISGRIGGCVLASALFGKYISDTDPDSYLKELGVKNGLAGIDFSLSSVCSDGETVRITAVYRIDFGVAGFPFVGYNICQSASTRAWLSEYSVDIGDIEDTVWKLPAFERGKRITSKIKDEYPFCAVKEGSGIDLLFVEEGRAVLVRSVNVFSKTYSDYNPNGYSKGDVSCYSLIKKSLIAELCDSAEELSVSYRKNSNKELEMETGQKYKLSANIKNKGIIAVLPSEACNAEMLSILDGVAKEVESKKGVSVVYRFFGNALD